MLSDFDEPHSVLRRQAAGFYWCECVLQRRSQTCSWRDLNKKNICRFCDSCLPIEHP